MAAVIAPRENPPEGRAAGAVRHENAACRVSGGDMPPAPCQRHPGRIKPHTAGCRDHHEDGACRQDAAAQGRDGARLRLAWPRPVRPGGEAQDAGGGAGGRGKGAKAALRAPKPVRKDRIHQEEIPGERGHGAGSGRCGGGRWGGVVQKDRSARRTHGMQPFKQASQEGLARLCKVRQLRGAPHQAGPVPVQAGK